MEVVEEVPRSILESVLSAGSVEDVEALAASVPNTNSFNGRPISGSSNNRSSACSLS